MEQLVIIAVIAAISFVNWLVKQSREARHRKALEERTLRDETDEEPSAQEHPEPPAASGGQDEQMRKFLEALGLPTDEPPPAIVRPSLPTRTEPPPVPRAAPARRPFAAPAQPVRAELMEPIFSTQKGGYSSEIAAAAASFATATSTGARTDDYRFHFPDKAHALRDAIVMREILGPPKALEYGA